MGDSSLAWDSWPAKIGILGVLILFRLLLTIPVRGRRRFAVVRENCDSVVITLAVVFLVLQPFVAQAFYIPTGSMANTLPPGDKILTSKIAYRLHPPQAGDVVVFEAPPAARALEGDEPQGTIYVKRCIGAPGDVIEVRNRVLWRNGHRVREPYTWWSSSDSYDMKIVGQAVYHRDYMPWSKVPGPWMQGIEPVSLTNQAAITAASADPVPLNSFLMLGDHRDQSSDGHYWGFVPRANIVGKVFAVFWPPRHWGVVDRKSGL